jgi:hypothetical protein
MASSGMLRRVALVRTNVSEELSVSFIRVTRIGELGTTLAVTSNRRTLRSSETSVLTTRSNVPEDAILNFHLFKFPYDPSSSLKFHIHCLSLLSYHEAQVITASYISLFWNRKAGLILVPSIHHHFMQSELKTRI